MKLFEVTSYSKCGSYFCSYLKSAIILAEDEKDARKIWRKLKEEHSTADVTPNFTELPMVRGVVSYDSSADY